MTCTATLENYRKFAFALFGRGPASLELRTIVAAGLARQTRRLVTERNGDINCKRFACLLADRQFDYRGSIARSLR